MESERAVGRRSAGGGRRREILAAAESLLEDFPSVEAVTLRGIARRAGMAAPSIYPHFPDRDAILEEVVEKAFAALGAALTAGVDPSAPADAQVLAICAAYVAFADASPGRYRLLFHRSGPNISVDRRAYPHGLDAFRTLVTAIARAVDEGVSGSVDPAGDAAALWAALHGLVVLRPATPGFPWPETDALVATTGRALARLRARPAQRTKARTSRTSHPA